MGSLGSQQGWIPYENVRDCSQGFCSPYCPQWCYIIFPPPPPIAFSDDDSRTNFSPLVIAIIGILASAFLLVSYYTVISKYCGNINSSRRNASNDGNEEFNENQNRPNSELWQVSRAGLDEALIKLITVCKYKKGDGLVEGTDCSVCLSEFEENEDLRLLPKCSHAFHLPCIDLWLKSHSNCPLCRANVVVPTPALPQLPSPVQVNPSDNRTSTESEQDHHTTVMVEDLERSNDEASHVNDLVPKMDGEGSEGRDIIIEIKDGGLALFRRSVSMDSSSQGRVSIADILSNSEDEESDTETHMYQPGVESSSTRKAGKHNKSTDRHRVLHCTMSPIAMKRSLSSGRFLFARQGRRSRM